MSKSTYEEKLDHYIRKIEKLKQKCVRKRRRTEDFHTSDRGNEGGDTGMWEVVEPQSDPDEDFLITNPIEPQVEIAVEAIKPASSIRPQAPPEPVQITDGSGLLDPEILSALGEATDSGPAWGHEILNNLSQLWVPLLKKGMTKEVKEKLTKQYLIPSNCMLLQAPKLNIEISAAVTEMVRIRDKKVEAKQQQLGVGITAISRAMTTLITSDNKIEAIKVLSDGCRILCDLHQSETRARIKMITPGLAKPFLNVIQDSERDETVFGTNLPDKIKASKTIEKQGLQIKKSSQSTRAGPSTSHIEVQAHKQVQGNWMGPPCYSTSREGRGGQGRFPSSSRRTTTNVTRVT